MSDAICDRCGSDNLTDLPVCPSCAVVVHFPHRLCFCASCIVAGEQAEQAAEPSLRLVAPSYVAEIKRAYASDALLCADMLSELEAA